ncbi:hypothetical protein DCAR_0208354 [Daucus carota subsp. sativus]|uniref:Uncharacterized protein n=1 Tax=Daucus carota subsp. sativus TaxID=79200 RepID=A0A166EHB2_DAUCS|nr:hypothetical protein DCAR_0208354 [Daucus carota subsp. sativus]
MLAIHSRDPLIIVPAEYTAGIISATSITAAANFIPQSLRHQAIHSVQPFMCPPLLVDLIIPFGLAVRLALVP